ncbi:hypothetical protein GA0115252_146450 [Streptomyces sp. DfronAA-171]|nr:hypothetical protein GA0115252_146450 [Streptomyces sp. DfronAA-171]
MSRVLARQTEGMRVQLHGGPLDGEHVDVDPADPDPLIAIIADGCSEPGGRSVYAPDREGAWRWERDLPWDAM